MKYLDPTFASDTSLQPIKNGTLQFLQDSHKESLANLIIGLLGANYNPNTCYRLWGGSVTIPNFSTTNPFTCITEPGAYFFNGEVFDVNLTTFSVNPLNQTILVTMQTVQYTPSLPLQADPVTFTNAAVHNVHNIRRVQLVAGPAGGAGVSNYMADLFGTATINTLIETPVITGVGLLNVSGTYPNINLNVTPPHLTGTGMANVTGTYPNLVVNVPPPPTPRNMVICAGTKSMKTAGTTNTNDVEGGGGGSITIHLDQDASPPLVGNTQDYYVMGTLRSDFNLVSGTSLSGNTTVLWTLVSAFPDFFTIWAREITGIQQDLYFDFICIAK